MCFNRGSLVWFFAAFVSSVPVLAQQRGMYGGVSTGQLVGQVSDPGFAGRLGATISGLPQTTSQIPLNAGIYGGRISGSGHSGGRRGNTVIVPYGVPVYGYGDGYGLAYNGSGYAPGYDTAPARALVQPVEAAPSVIINQYFTPDMAPHPQLREYNDLPEPPRPPQGGRPRMAPDPSQEKPPAGARNDQPAADKPTVTLLAFQDSSIAAVIAYWTQNEDLHYITKTFKKNVVPLSTLDKAASEQLNRERNIEFTLE